MKAQLLNLNSYTLIIILYVGEYFGTLYFESVPPYLSFSWYITYSTSNRSQIVPAFCLANFCLTFARQGRLGFRLLRLPVPDFKVGSIGEFGREHPSFSLLSGEFGLDLNAITLPSLRTWPPNSIVLDVILCPHLRFQQILIMTGYCISTKHLRNIKPTVCSR